MNSINMSKKKFAKIIFFSTLVRKKSNYGI